MKKFLLLLYKDYDHVIDKVKRDKNLSPKERKLYLEAKLAWEIFWYQAKMEIPEIPLDTPNEDFFLYRGFDVSIHKKPLKNVKAFTGDYNPEPAPDPEDNIEIDPKNILPFPGIHASGED